MSFITRALGATKLALKAKGPTILVTTGVVSMGAGAVVGAVKTLKAEAIIEKHVEDLDKIQQALGLDVESYGAAEARNDRFGVYVRASWDLGKHYAVPGVLFFGGAGMVFFGHNLMIKRNATLAVAFTGLKKSFDAYRSRVREQFGDEVDQGMMSGHVVRQEQDPVTGEIVDVHTRDWDSARKDPYNRVFEQGSSNQWRNDLGLNKFFVANQQAFAQERLVRQGYLYLNDVYDSLGFPTTDVGQVVGWKVKELPDGSKDIPHVDFGLDKAMPDDWKYNQEKAIYLDFNCHGLIVGGDIQRILEKA